MVPKKRLHQDLTPPDNQRQVPHFLPVVKRPSYGLDISEPHHQGKKRGDARPCDFRVNDGNYLDQPFIEHAVDSVADCGLCDVQSSGEFGTRALRCSRRIIRLSVSLSTASPWTRTGKRCGFTEPATPALRSVYPA